MSHDTPEAIAITDKVAAELLIQEKAFLNVPIVGEICPVGTLETLRKLKEILA